MADINDFPSYMGFGRIHAKSITEDAENVIAEYLFNDKPVHRITYDKVNDNWHIADIFDDTGSITFSKDLKGGVTRHFNYLDCKMSNLFHFYREHICNIGNIYFQDLLSMKDEGGVASYYPAGRLVILRLPIFFDEKGRAIADSLINNIPYLELEKRPLLKLCEAYNSSIVLSNTTGVATVIPVLIFEYIVTLASLFDVVVWMVDNNLIPPDLKYRLIIQDAKCKNEHSAQTFNDESTSGEIYTLLTKGYDETTIKFEDFHDKMVPAG